MDQEDEVLPPFLLRKSRLFERDSDILNPIEFSDLGMWVMTTKRKPFTYFAENACRLYNKGSLTGIIYLKLCLPPTGTEGTIMFYCGPSSDKDMMISYGEELVKKLDYHSPSGQISFRLSLRTDRNEVCYEVDVPTSIDIIR